ncbi:hypothetical protein C8R45DRAFT_1223200 [Mycena sanguinolenta]|nr:hypothetical protein C8R45DRAFT_1223200 [Mycena sanguinolenta]
MSNDLYPNLPLELERRIFEIAALARPVGIPVLMRVARRVKCWCGAFRTLPLFHTEISRSRVEPLLYRVVFFPRGRAPSTPSLPTFTADVLKLRFSCLQYVQYLFLHVYPDLDNTILLACTGVTNLLAHYTSNILSSLSTLTSVQYLTIDARALGGTTLPQPLFLTVTHLRLLETTGVAMDRVWQNIARIPPLAHFASHSGSRLSHSDLCANVRFQCIVFITNPSFPNSALLDRSPLRNDSRFVLVEEKGDYRVDWLNGAIFGVDYWALADDFISARRAGKIGGSQYRISNEIHNNGL